MRDTRVWVRSKYRGVAIVNQRRPGAGRICDDHARFLTTLLKGPKFLAAQVSYPLDSLGLIQRAPMSIYTWKLNKHGKQVARAYVKTRDPLPPGGLRD